MDSPFPHTKEMKLKWKNKTKSKKVYSLWDIFVCLLFSKTISLIVISIYKKSSRIFINPRRKDKIIMEINVILKSFEGKEDIAFI